MEILIVIAILAVLITFVVPNFVGARKRARDAVRKSDLSQIQKAMELYKSDQSPPSYPATGFFDSALCDTCWSSGGNCSGNIYMRKVPCDPVWTGSPYIYTLDPVDNSLYTLTACLENYGDIDQDATPVTECTDLGRLSYTINEP